MWNKKKAITRSNSSDAPSFLSTTNRFHCCEAGSLCVDAGKQCIKAGKLELLVGSLRIGAHLLSIVFCSLRAAIYAL